MYRRPAPREPEPRPPAELVCMGADREHRRRLSLVALQGVPLAALIGAVLSASAGQVAGLVGMVVSAATAAGVWRWQRRQNAEQVVLRVEHGRVEVCANGSKAWIRLDDLMDVTLDTKTIQRVQDGGSAIPAVRFIESQVGPEIETARVVLVARDQPCSVWLTEEYISHLDATEWFGKIRVFLRKHGWVPEDERDLEPDSDAPSSA
ncbi:hypothetical protein [Pendulispora albinea]|uniref:Uncharacterized protein n=1 Tax=Pendulispora albinea TaxID=2741071 RepID=A0ABZ2LW91_9BACT